MHSFTALASFRSSRWFLATVVYAATFTDGILHGAVIPILPYALERRSNIPQDDVLLWASILIMSFGAAGMLGAPVAAWVVNRTETRKLPFTVSLIAAILGTAIFGLGRATWHYILARAIQGLSATVLYTASMALVSDAVDSTEIGSWIGFVLSGNQLGLLIGPFLGGFLYQRLGYDAVFIGILACLGLVVLLTLVMIEPLVASKQLGVPYTINVQVKANGQAASVPSTDIPQETQPLLPARDDPGIESAKTVSPFHLIRRYPSVRTALAGAFIQAFITLAFDTILPVFVRRTFQWDAEKTGLLFLAITVPAIAGGLIGAMVDKCGARTVSVVGCILLAASVAALALIDGSTLEVKILFCSLLVISGFGMVCILSALATDAFHNAEILSSIDPVRYRPKETFIQSYCAINLGLGLGTVIGPPLSGLLYGYIGWDATVLVLAAMVAIVGVEIVRHIGSKRCEPRNA